MKEVEKLKQAMLNRRIQFYAGKLAVAGDEYFSSFGTPLKVESRMVYDEESNSWRTQIDAGEASPEHPHQ